MWKFYNIQNDGIPEFPDPGRKCWMLDSRRWALDSGHCTLDVGLKVLNYPNLGKQWRYIKNFILAFFIDEIFGHFRYEKSSTVNLFIFHSYIYSYTHHLYFHVLSVASISSSNLNPVKWPWHTSSAFPVSWNIVPKKLQWKW